MGVFLGLVLGLSWDVQVRVRDLSEMEGQEGCGCLRVWKMREEGKW